MTVGVSLDAHLSPQWLIERVPFVRGGDTLLQLRDQTSAGNAVGHDGDAVAFQDDSRDKRGRWSTEAPLCDVGSPPADVVDETNGRCPVARDAKVPAGLRHRSVLRRGVLKDR